MKTLLCTLMILAVVTFKINAQAPDFSPNHDVVLCGPNDVYFVCTSPQDPHNITWDFGDGTTATGINPVHFYATTGSYDVKLVVEKNGIKDSIVKVGFVTVNPQPEAKFTRVTEPIPNPFTRVYKFTGFSNADSISAYSWKINDTVVAVTRDLTYTFPRSDWFRLSLTVENNKGCSDMDEDSIFVSGDVEGVGIPKVRKVADYLVSITPDQHQLRIENRSGGSQSGLLKVYDITGRIELKEPINASQTVSVYDISDLYPGIHIIEVSNQSSTAVKRLQKFMQ